MMDRTFLIRKNGQIAPEFVRANLYLLEEHSTDFVKLSSDQDRLEFLIGLWYKEYKAELIVSKGIPFSLKFAEIGDFLLWKMKWSN